jgi:GGDEF domain-containing protein
VSIGVAAFPEHGDDARTLLRAADATLDQAKRDDVTEAAGRLYTPPCKPTV